MKTEPVTRELKKARVREKIIRAALVLFESKGYEKTTIDEIASAAEVSTRTFFRYFPSKELLMFPHHAAYIERFNELLREHADAGSPMETVSMALRSMAELYMSASSEHLRYQRIISTTPALFAKSIPADAQWEDAIAEVWRKGRRNPSKDREAALIAGAIMGAINALMSMWYAGGCKQDLLSWGESTLTLLKTGIGDGRATGILKHIKK